MSGSNRGKPMTCWEVVPRRSAMIVGCVVAAAPSDLRPAGGLALPNQRSLLVAAQPQIQPKTLLGDDAPADTRARLEALMAAFTRYNVQWEPQLPAALRLSLEPGAERPLLRQGQAVRWIEDALAPLGRTHPNIDRHELAVAMRSATGIEALTWLQDIAGQSRRQAASTVRRTALALLDSALREGTPEP